MSRRGFALIAVLWVVTLLAAVLVTADRELSQGARASANRLLLTRGRWAAEACGALAQARWTEAHRSRGDTVALGRGTRCVWSLEDPDLRVDLNAASRVILARLMIAVGERPDSAAAWAERIARRRDASPYESVAELADVAPVPAEVLTMLTVEGDGRVSASARPDLLVAALGLPAEAAAAIESRRALGRPVRSVDDLVAVLPASARDDLLAHYADVARSIAFSPSRLILRAEGWVDGASRSPVATIEWLVVPDSARLGIVWRRLL
jgi:type II secretory pathway component PulK